MADGRVTLVFVTRRETVRYLRDRLGPPAVAWCTGERAGRSVARATCHGSAMVIVNPPQVRDSAKATRRSGLVPIVNEAKQAARKPDGVVGKTKIGVVNRLLAKCREVLADEASLPFLDTLDEDDVLQSSDVVLNLSQYVAAMSQFREVYYGWDGTDHSWAVTGTSKRRR